MVQDVDQSTVLSSGTIDSPFLGIIGPQDISGGVKNLILMLKDDDWVYDLSACGDNCAKWALEIGKQKDVKAHLGHTMNFQEPFVIHMVDDYTRLLDKDYGKVIESYLDYLTELSRIRKKYRNEGYL